MLFGSTEVSLWPAALFHRGLDTLTLAPVEVIVRISSPGCATWVCLSLRWTNVLREGDQGRYQSAKKLAMWLLSETVTLLASPLITGSDKLRMTCPIQK